MDEHMNKLIVARIENVVERLKKNRMQAFYVKDQKELHAKIKKMLPKGASTAIGGSMTLKETGVLDLIQSADYHYIDRNGDDLKTSEEKEHRKREVFFADYFFSGTNAITEDGELYNVDGMGSRVAPMTFGPKNVVVISGHNKIVKDTQAALERVRAIAAPANNIRLKTGSPCIKTGKCMDCKNDKRICSFYVRTGFQMVKDRITVLILPEEFGY